MSTYETLSLVLSIIEVVCILLVAFISNTKK